MHHPEIDRFAHLESPLHRWDPRWKLATLFFLLFAMGLGPAPEAVTLRDVAMSGVSLAISLILLWCSRIPLGFALRRLRGIVIFLVAVVFVFALSASQWLAGILIALRATAMVLLVFPAFGTTRFDVAMKALRSLRVPNPVIQVILFSYRYFFVHADQLRRMRSAMCARGFQVQFGLTTPKVLGHAVGVLLVGSVERTERIHGAMLCRGYSGSMRTLTTFQTTPRDVLWTVAIGVVGVALVAWRIV